MWKLGLAAALLAGACGQPQTAPSPVAVTEPAKAAAPLTDPNTKEMRAAMLAAYRAADPATGRLTQPADPGRGETTTRGLFLTDAGAFHVLATAREEQDGCHACSGAVSIFYLARAGDAFTVTKSFPDLAQSGAWGQIGEINPLTLGQRSGFMDDSGYTAQGCTSSRLDVYLFAPDGPVKALESLPLAFEYNEAAIGGEIVPAPQGADFAVHYTGATGEAGAPKVDATVAFKLDGAKLVKVSGEIPPLVDKGC